MKFSTLLFLVFEALRGIWRNGLMSLAAVGTVTVALTILGASTLTAYSIHLLAEKQPERLGEVDAFLKTSATREEAMAVQTRIEQMSEVRRVVLVTREEAWLEIQQNQPIVKEAELTNPLPDSFRIEVAGALHMAPLLAQLGDRARFPEIDRINSSDAEVKSLLALARMVRILGAVVSLALFAATLFTVYNTARLTVYARRREIRIMQLVGATPGFIRFPLLLEGVLHGIAGAILACAILALLTAELTRFINTLHSPLFADVAIRIPPLEFAGGLIAIGAIIGALGSFLAMRRFLKQV